MPAAKSRGSPRRSPSSPSNQQASWQSDPSIDLTDDRDHQSARHLAGLFVARHIRTCGRSTTGLELEDPSPCPCPRAALRNFTCRCFATPETFGALRKTLAVRAQVEFSRARALHTVVSPDHCWRWSYPAEQDSKNGVSIITYPHSDDKHLKNELARHPREGFVKYFWPPFENCHTSRFVFDSAR
jgi:hypothetical protein